METFVTAINPQVILILLAAGFIASFIDSVVGGGGLVSLPTFLLVGLPPHLALGTNKLAGTISSLTSFLSFLRSGKIRLDIIKYLFWLSLAGSVAGAYIVQQIPSTFLRPLVISLLVLVAIYTFLKKNWGENSNYTGLTAGMAVITAVMSVLLGFYDGFFGPGTGSFLLFSFLFLGFDFVESSGNAKALNFASNIGSLATFMLLDAVQYLYGLTMGIGMAAGAYIGSRVAIRKGSTYVRPLFLCVTVVMISKQIWDLLR